MRVLLIRHGESESNVNQTFGGTTDALLTKKGHMQAEKCAETLKAEKIDKLITTDLSRAKVTAEYINKYQNLDIEINNNFSEMNFGKFEGMTYQEILDQYPKEAIEWRDHYVEYTLPEGESLETFYERSNTAFTRMMTALRFDRSINYDDYTVAIVAHGGTIQSILTQIYMNDIESYWKFAIDNCGIAIVEYLNGFPILKGLNIK